MTDSFVFDTFRFIPASNQADPNRHVEPLSLCAYHGGA
jgi:hypothetical protein